jgi:NitT/TauT family transport system substrate-binding protein
MKKLNMVFLGLSLIVAFAWAGGSSQEAEKSSELGLKKIRVAVMPFFLSTPVNYIKEQGLDKAAGLDMEVVMFSNGAAMNEALGANLWDVAPTGGAAIFGVANFQAKFIADFVDGTGGNEIYVRKDSKILNTRGYNQRYPNIYGDPGTVRGATFLQTTGTTAQLNVIKYIKALGLSDTDVKVVHLEFPQVFQGFLAGQGDIASLVSPYVFRSAENNWVKVADLKSLDTQLFETVIANPRAYQNMKNELAMFLNILFKANEALERDPVLKFNEVKKWYQQNGTEVNDEAVRQECDLKSFLTKDAVRQIDYGKYQRDYGEFLVSIQMLNPEQLNTINQNTMRDILDTALAME